MHEDFLFDCGFGERPFVLKRNCGLLWRFNGCGVDIVVVWFGRMNMKPCGVVK